MKRMTTILARLLVLTTILTACGPAANSPETTEATQMVSNNDGVLNLLMIGSSYCYYYVEELMIF